MNKRDCDILLQLARNVCSTQRFLAEICECSVGSINQSLPKLVGAGYLHEDRSLTVKSIQLLEDSKPQSAIILTAGFGLRMVPINMETSKGLLEVNGEPLIERLIRQQEFRKFIS